MHDSYLGFCSLGNCEKHLLRLLMGRRPGTRVQKKKTDLGLDHTILQNGRRARQRLLNVNLLKKKYRSF